MPDRRVKRSLMHKNYRCEVFSAQARLVDEFVHDVHVILHKLGKENMFS